MTISSISTAEAMGQFQAALAARGLIAEHIIGDGQLHRCGTEGKPRDKDGAYVLYLDGFPAGGFENHRDGQGWESWHAHTGDRPLSKEEERARDEAMLIAWQASRARGKEKASKAQLAAQALWKQAKPAKTHPYLQRKYVKAHGTRVIKRDQARSLTELIPGGLSAAAELLVIPIRGEDKHIQTLQLIDANGTKRFLIDGQKRGGYFSIGKPEGVLCIAEGFATGASIHQATGYAVAVAFDVGNVYAVAELMRRRFPKVQIVICADDDWQAEGNPGLTKANEAARAVNGVVAVPEFGEFRRKEDTDFNDLAYSLGTVEVVRCIDLALKRRAKPAETAAIEPAITVNVALESEAKPAAVSAASAVVETEEKEKEQAKPLVWNGEPICFSCASKFGDFELSKEGVTFTPWGEEGKRAKEPLRVCSPLYVAARAANGEKVGWGRYLQWHDPSGTLHNWVMPVRFLHADAGQLCQELADQGLEITTGRTAHSLLQAYINEFPTDRLATCTDTLGWDAGRYIRPDQVIGDTDSEEHILFQSHYALRSELSSKGSSATWRETVAAKAAGNSRLVFALSAALAGPLLDMAGEQSGGFHLRGESSSGKSTALKLASSVWGNPARYGREWRATANGLEGLAALHTDGLLVLDELSQIDPKQAGEAAYLLANGQGKARASRNGSARPCARWRVLFLSAGEQSLPDLMTQAGKKTNIGQEIRLVDIEADAGAEMGVFENVHGASRPVDFAVELNSAALENYGAVGLEWLQHLVAQRPQLMRQLSTQLDQFVQSLDLPASTQGQVHRVARRFALVAVAGEWASRAGLTGWKAGEATQAVQACFKSWLKNFGGTGNGEERKILNQVRGYFEAHGQSRFQNIDADPDKTPIIHNRVGFYSNSGEYLVFKDALFEKIAEGHSPVLVKKTLLAAGWLERGKKGIMQYHILPGMGKTGVYVFNRTMWEAENADE